MIAPIYILTIHHGFPLATGLWKSKYFYFFVI
jgi:hypothetical protein